MKDKKIIAYKKEQTKKIAFNLRKLLVKAVMQKWSRLGEEQVKNKSQAERIRIEDDRSDLYIALHVSICMCPGCHQTGGAMVYNATLKEWYCTLCAQEYRDFYHENKAIIDQGGFVGDFNEDFHSSFL